MSGYRNPFEVEKEKSYSDVDLGLERGDSFSLDNALRMLAKSGGSDLHLMVGATPMVRIDGELKPLSREKLTDKALLSELSQILSKKQSNDWLTNKEVDFSYSIDGVGRFRVSYGFELGRPTAAFRFLSNEIKSSEELGLPPQVENFSELPRGLVLFTGPTGSGKSTSQAAIIDKINSEKSGVIITVEDPIEYVHPHKKSIVSQREVGRDTDSFSDALRQALRQDPDVIQVGELRDLETISIALTAAETGHLVFATLHTQDTAQAIDRIIDVFPAAQQGQIRTQLASTLQGIVCQNLIPNKDTGGRSVATEVLLATPAVANLIRENKGHQIYSTLQSGVDKGMQTMDQSLAKLVNEGKISYNDGLSRAHDVGSFNDLVNTSIRFARK